MSQHYSRRQKSSTEDKEPTRQNIKKVFSLSKTVALIGLFLVSLWQVLRLLMLLKGHQPSPTDKSTTTVVIKVAITAKRRFSILSIF